MTHFAKLLFCSGGNLEANKELFAYCYVANSIEIDFYFE